MSIKSFSSNSTNKQANKKHINELSMLCGGTVVKKNKTKQKKQKTKKKKKKFNPTFLDT